MCCNRKKITPLEYLILLVKYDHRAFHRIHNNLGRWIINRFQFFNVFGGELSCALRYIEWAFDDLKVACHRSNFVDLLLLHLLNLHKNVHKCVPALDYGADPSADQEGKV